MFYLLSSFGGVRALSPPKLGGEVDTMFPEPIRLLNSRNPGNYIGVETVVDQTAAVSIRGLFPSEGLRGANLLFECPARTSSVFSRCCTGGLGLRHIVLLVGVV